MNEVIQINNLFKEYNLGVIGRGTLYRDIQSLIAKLQGKEDPNSLIGFEKENSQLSNKKFLALKEINLSVKQGEVLGIIGANGAGKSTLLKILSRITAPSLGEIKIKGKIASLLEVGTGFHAELTGRENIYLNGAINGMSKKRIDKIIDQIIDFSGIKKHIDTPLKRYSSGMEVRLGFSVAAFFDCDILICDEVLAVGDHIFQEKAISKMKDISSNQGKTVLFVSHNMNSISKLCTKVLIMNKGNIIDQGEPNQMISNYTNSDFTHKRFKSIEWNKLDESPGGDIVRLKSIKTLDGNNYPRKSFSIDEDVIIEIEYYVLKDEQNICINLTFSSDQKTIFQSLDDYTKENWDNQKKINKGLYSSKCKIKKNLFNEGIIDLNIVIFTPPADIDSAYQVMLPKRDTGILSFEIVDNFSVDSARGTYPYAWHKDCVIRPECNWSKLKIN